MLNAINVLYVIVYDEFWWFVVYVWRVRLYVMGVRPGHLVVLRVGNLNESNKS